MQQRLLRTMHLISGFQRIRHLSLHQKVTALPNTTARATRHLASYHHHTLSNPEASVIWRTYITSLPRNYRFNATYAKKNSGEKADEDSDAVGEFEEDVDITQFEDDLDTLEENDGPDIVTNGTDWGEAALAIIPDILPADGDIQLFSLRALTGQQRLDIRLDKLSDEFGSPSLDEVEEFSRNLYDKMESKLGEAAGAIEIEVSSPGAERLVRLPHELERFSELPMKVQYSDTDGEAQIRYLDYYETDEATSVTKWRLADVRINRAAKGKGRGLNKKERETVIEIPLEAIKQVNLHVDI